MNLSLSLQRWGTVSEQITAFRGWRGERAVNRCRAVLGHLANHSEPLATNIWGCPPPGPRPVRYGGLGCVGSTKPLKRSSLSLAYDLWFANPSAAFCYTCISVVWLCNVPERPNQPVVIRISRFPQHTFTTLRTGVRSECAITGRPSRWGDSPEIARAADRDPRRRLFHIPAKMPVMQEWPSAWRNRS